MSMSYQEAKRKLGGAAPDFYWIARAARMMTNPKESAEILLECFMRCPPGELDDVKFNREETSEEKCLAADIDDRGCIEEGVCGVKLNEPEYQEKMGGSEYGCDYIGHTRDCPWYCGGKGQLKRVERNGPYSQDHFGWTDRG